jgi:hypothetical protein
MWKRCFSHFKRVYVNGIKFTASDSKDGNNFFILVSRKCKALQAKIIFWSQRGKFVNLWMRINKNRSKWLRLNYSVYKLLIRRFHVPCQNDCVINTCLLIQTSFNRKYNKYSNHRQGTRHDFFSEVLRPAVDPIHHPIQWIPGLKRLEPEFVHLNAATFH